MADIKFGTSGWRAIIAEDFTFENVRLATAGIVELVKRTSIRPSLIVGYDTRFQANQFAQKILSKIQLRITKVFLFTSEGLRIPNYQTNILFAY